MTGSGKPNGGLPQEQSPAEENVADTECSAPHEVQDEDVLGELNE
jgi:hypothetical protein